MEIFIIGDEKGGFILKLLNKAGYSCISCSWRHVETAMQRIQPNDFVIAVPPPKLIADVNNFDKVYSDCVRLMNLAEMCCLITLSGEMSGIIPPTMAIRTPGIAHRSFTHHIWLKGNLPMLSIAKRKTDMNFDNMDYHIIEPIANAMFKQWRELFVRPVQFELPFKD